MLISFRRTSGRAGSGGRTHPGWGPEGRPERWPRKRTPVGRGLGRTVLVSGGGLQAWWVEMDGDGGSRQERKEGDASEGRAGGLGAAGPRKKPADAHLFFSPDSKLRLRAVTWRSY